MNNLKYMKRISMLLLLSVFTIGVAQAQAQVKVSAVACPQFNEDFGVRAGSDFDIPISSRWSFVPGIYWSLRNRQSNNNSTADGSTKQAKFDDKAHFITLPLRFGLRFSCKNENKFALKFLFGPYIAYGIDGTSKSTVNSDGKITSHQTGAFDEDGRYKSRLDYGINLGLNSTINQHYKVGIFCESGLRKIYNANSTLEDIMGELFVTNKINLAFGVVLGYQF
jgi:hypothetical protein